MVLLDWPPQDHLWIERGRGTISAMRLGDQRPPACLSKSRPELHVRNTAAQTGTVSAGELWPSKKGLSQHLKYMARARISEFESSHPSQAVRSLRCDFPIDTASSAMRNDSCARVKY